MACHLNYVKQSAIRTEGLQQPCGYVRTNNARDLNNAHGVHRLLVTQTLNEGISSKTTGDFANPWQ